MFSWECLYLLTFCFNSHRFDFLRHLYVFGSVPHIYWCSVMVYGYMLASMRTHTDRINGSTWNSKNRTGKMYLLFSLCKCSDATQPPFVIKFPSVVSSWCKRLKCLKNDRSKLHSVDPAAVWCTGFLHWSTWCVCKQTHYSTFWPLIQFWGSQYKVKWLADSFGLIKLSPCNHQY